jgi:hypothetical protein
MDAKYESLIDSARIRVKEAEAELIRAKGWLRSITDEAARSEKTKVSEGSRDSRTLLNG